MERIIIKKQTSSFCCLHIRYRFLISVLLLITLALHVIPPIHRTNKHPTYVTAGGINVQSNTNNPQQDQRFQNIPWLNSEEDRLKTKLSMVGKTEITTNCTKKFPKVIIIGVMKGGTEAFSTFLGIHPRIAMQFRLLSTRFFTNLNYDKGLDWYLEQMPCTKENQITVEKAPQYFPTSVTPPRIYEFDPAIKLILLVRHPIHRAVSHFLQQQYANPQRLNGESFEQNILDANGEIDPNNIYIYQSSYIIILQKWLKYFSLDQMLIIDGDNFRSDAVSELAKAETFIGVQPYIKQDMFELHPERKIYCVKSAVTKEDLCLPSEKGRKHPDIQPEVYDKLAKHFKPLNEAFMKAVGLTFDWD